MKISELKSIKEQIAKEESLIEKKHIKIKKLTTKLQDNCKHPKRYVITKEYYSSGGYDYTSYTDYTPHCTLCGKDGETTTINHGQYG